MATGHKIEWCDVTWNPFTGCLHGCKYCYARKFSRRLAGISGTIYYELKKMGLDPFTPVLDFDKLSRMWQVLKDARKPKRIFLGSMADIAGDWKWRFAVDGEITEPVCASHDVQEIIKGVCEGLDRHAFLILTKNPRNLISEWPDNVHMGISLPEQDGSSVKLSCLMNEIKAGVRWTRVEPLLDADMDLFHSLDNNLIPEWVVIGGLSGKKPQDRIVKTAKRIVNECRNRGVPCFVKKNMRRGDGRFNWPMELPPKNGKTKKELVLGRKERHL